MKQLLTILTFLAFGYYNTRIGWFKQGVVGFVHIPLSIVWSNQLTIHIDIQTFRV